MSAGSISAIFHTYSADTFRISCADHTFLSCFYLVTSFKYTLWYLLSTSNGNKTYFYIIHHHPTTYLLTYSLTYILTYLLTYLLTY